VKNLNYTNSEQTMKEQIPVYDPLAEGRKHPKPGEEVSEGYWIGQGENRRLIIPEEVWKLCSIGCTNTEIAQWFDCPEPTLKENFGVYMLKARAHLKQRLRRAQIKHALAGNPTLLIWLGKNMLGQSDNPNQAEDDLVLPWTERESESEE